MFAVMLCMQKTLIPYVSCIVAILGASYPKWPNNFRWATSGDHILFKRHKYKCTQFKEPNDLKWTSNKYLCWKGQTTVDLQFSNSGMSQYSVLLMPLAETIKEFVSFILKGVYLIYHTSIFLLCTINHYVTRKYLQYEDI